MNAPSLATQIAEAYRRVDAVARTLHSHLSTERLSDAWYQSAEEMFHDLDEAIAEVNRLEAASQTDGAAKVALEGKSIGCGQKFQIRLPRN
jgi:hypothetical protein